MINAFWMAEGFFHCITLCGRRDKLAARPSVVVISSSTINGRSSDNDVFKATGSGESLEMTGNSICYYPAISSCAHRATVLHKSVIPKTFTDTLQISSVFELQSTSQTDDDEVSVGEFLLQETYLSIKKLYDTRSFIDFQLCRMSDLYVRCCKIFYVFTSQGQHFLNICLRK